MSDNRPYRTWKAVLAIIEEVPAYTMVDAQFSSRPIVRSMIPIELWSIYVINIVEAKVANTMSRARDKRLVWSWIWGAILLQRAIFSGD
jgi:hypothetical protein